MTIATIENDTRKEKAEARKAIREAVKHQKRIDEIKAQPRLESLTITIEWKKSRMWGSNPHATGEARTIDGKYLTGHATASGCGYCKRSSVVAEIFSQFLRHKLFEDLNPVDCYHGQDASKIPYGIRLPKTGDKYLPYFERGIGIGCFDKISEALGGKWETIANAENTDVYRWTAVQS